MLLYRIATILSNRRQEWQMAYGFVHDVPADEEMYGKIRARLGAAPPRGLVSHVAMAHDGGLRYVDVWETQGDWERFRDEAVEPAVTEVLSGYGLPHDDTLTTF